MFKSYLMKKTVIFFISAIVLLALTYYLIGRLFKNDQNVEYCDINGKIYTELKEHSEEWSRHFEEGGASFSISSTNPPSAVFLTTTSGGTRILIVEVDRGSGLRRIRGQSGYFFTPTSELPNFFSVYGYDRRKFEIEALDDNIYCYKMD